MNHRNKVSRTRSGHAPGLMLVTSLLAALAAVTIACSIHNPDEIRQRTAQATETIKHDAKAVAEGVKEGIAGDKTININKAKREDLLSLPGVTERQADRIIAGRPFEKAHDLVSRRVLTEAQYDKIRDRVIAGH